MTLQERYDARAKLVKEQRDLLSKAEAEQRDLTAEETGQYEARDLDIDTATKTIERELHQAELEKRERDLDRIQAPSAPRLDPDPPRLDEQREQRGNVRHNATPEYADAFWKGLREGRQALTPEDYALLRGPEARAMQVGTDSEGGYVVPDEFNRTLIEALQANNVMRSLCTVIQTSSGTMEIPTVASNGVAAWVAEEADTTPTDDAFGQVTLGAHKATRMILVSEELMADAYFDMESYVARSFGISFGLLEEAAFLVGTGSGQPTGITGSAGTGVTAAATTAVTADELIDLYHSLARQYRTQATFMAADATIKLLRKLVDTGDGTDQYIWQPGLQAGEPDRLLGRPLIASAYMPAATAGLDAILFGDLSYYTIADRGSRSFRRLDELYAVSGQIGFRAWQRVEGKLTLAAAAKVLVMAAS